MTDRGSMTRYAVWFDPQSIRDHYAARYEPGEHAIGDFVAAASDDDLHHVADEAMADDRLWELYGRILDDEISWQMFKRDDIARRHKDSTT
jgi:hypothetical protein